MKRLRNVNGNTTYIYKEISFITILDVTTRRQSIANPPMEDSYGRLHMNIDVREIKQVVNILHIHLQQLCIKPTGLLVLFCAMSPSGLFHTNTNAMHENLHNITQLRTSLGLPPVVKEHKIIRKCNENFLI